MPGVTLQQLQQMGAQPAQPQAAPQGQGISLQQLQQMGAKPVQAPQQPSLGGFAGNVASSAGNFLGGIGNAVMHPLQTVQNLGGAAVGGLEELTGASNAQGGDANTQKWDAIVNFYKQRYGSPDAFLQTAYKDPVGFLADASMLASGVGAGLKAAGTLGETGNVLSKAGQIASKVGEAANPASLVTKPIAALGSGFSNLQSSMEEANLRLTPTQAANLGDKVKNITDFISENLPVGSPETRFKAIGNISDQMENTLQATLRDNPEVAAITVPKKVVIDQLKTLPDKFMDDPALYPLAKRQITEAIQAIQDTQPEEIPLAQLNKIKRSYSGNAFDQLGVRLKNEVKLAISGVPRTLIEDTLAANMQEIKLPAQMQPLFDGMESVPIKDFNKVYGTVLQSKTFLKLAANKAEAGPFARILSGVAGGSVGSVMGGPIGAAAGAAVGEGITSRFATPLRSIAGKAGAGVGSVLVRAPKINTAALGAAQAGNASRNVKVRVPKR